MFNNKYKLFVNNSIKKVNFLEKIIIIFSAFFLDQLAIAFISFGFLIDRSNFLTSFLFVFGFFVFFFVAKFLYKKMQRVNPYEKLEKMTKKNYQISLFGFSIIFILEILFSVIISLFHLGLPENQIAINQILGTFNLFSLIFILITIFIAPIIEELLFRGYIMNYFFKSYYNKILLSGFLFGFVHVINSISFDQFLNPFFYFSWLLYSLMGIILAWVYAKTGKIEYSILTHFLINIMASYSQIINWFI